MPRPKHCRRIQFEPGVTYFKPAGIRITDLEEVLLHFEEYEAIRLIDLEEIDQEQAGKKMQISQPTLSRLLKSARKKIAEAVIQGKAIKIEGGSYEFKK